MTTHNEPEHRQYIEPSPDSVEYRELTEDEDGLFAIRMPIASTGGVRNEGDDPLSRSELDGMREQINDRDVGVFLAHGQSFEITDARYGQTERLGTWRDAELREGDHDDDDDDEDRATDDAVLLVADAVMADPESLPSATGRYREALAIIKEQAKRDIPLSASIGWREDEDMPGGNDLMEASIVGIPADPRTVMQDAQTEVLARAAVSAGADPEAFVEVVRGVVMDASDESEQMTDTDNEPDAENDASDTETDEEQTEQRDEAPEWADRMLELQEQTVETLGDVAEAVRQDDDDDDDDDEEEENETDEDDEDDDDEENSGGDESEEEREARELRDHLAALREGGIDVSDVELPDNLNDTDEQETEQAVDSDPYNKYGMRPIN